MPSALELRIRMPRPVLRYLISFENDRLRTAEIPSRVCRHCPVVGSQSRTLELYHDADASVVLVGGSRTCCTISMEILRIYILKEWKEDLSSYGKGQLSMKTL
jgi:hypothetical protein